MRPVIKRHPVFQNVWTTGKLDLASELYFYHDGSPVIKANSAKGKQLEMKKASKGCVTYSVNRDEFRRFECTQQFYTLCRVSCKQLHCIVQSHVHVQPVSFSCHS